MVLSFSLSRTWNIICPLTGSLQRLASKSTKRRLNTITIKRPTPTETPIFIITRSHSEHSDSDTERPEAEKKQQPVKMQKPTLSESVKKARAESIWGLFVGDSLSMPVHWFYDPEDIVNSYGSWITGYVAPVDNHPSSILTVSDVGGSGRNYGSSRNHIIGKVILHDKLKYWDGSTKVNHYHQGMKAGDNTLNPCMALNELKTIDSFDHDMVKPERDVRGAVLEEYVKFMTTPSSHSDTYAESFHRSFFKDWVKCDKPKSSEEILDFTEKRCKEMWNGRPDSQLAAVGSFVPAIPWVIRNVARSEDECAKNVADFIKLTHPVPSLMPFIDVYSRLLHSVLNGKDLKSEVLRVLSNSILGGPAKRDMILAVLDKAQRIPKGSEDRLKMYQAVTARLGSACYVEGAFSSLLFLALEFHDDFEGGVLANANCGGENCHRGAALGALLAAEAANKGRGVPDLYKNNLQALKSGIVSLINEMNDGL